MSIEDQYLIEGGHTHSFATGKCKWCGASFTEVARRRTSPWCDRGQTLIEQPTVRPEQAGALA